jgi:hypothetical protein
LAFTTTVNTLAPFSNQSAEHTNSAPCIVNSAPQGFQSGPLPCLVLYSASQLPTQPLDDSISTSHITQIIQDRTIPTISGDLLANRIGKTKPRARKSPQKTLASKSKANKKGTATSLAPRIHSSWFKSDKFSDVTIKYGNHGFDYFFHGHRIVLCNASEWFSLVLDSVSPTTLNPTITLTKDDKDALDALFEYCYLGTYTTYTQKQDEGTYLDAAKDIFMRNARAFVVANKYMVDGMANLAAERIEGQIQGKISLADGKARRVFKFVVETVYLREHLFGYDQAAVDEGARMKKAVETKENNAAAGQEDVKMSDGYVDEGVGEDEEDFDPRELHAISPVHTSHHPLDRLRSIVARAAVDVWEQPTDTLGRQHLAVLVEKIPVFGTDLAKAALATARVLQNRNKANPEQPTTLSPRIRDSWYQNPDFSDITIKYGANGTNVFHGHNLVLCNSSDKFLSSLCGGFKEANAREIRLKDDHADGLKGLFEYCYSGTYTDCTAGTTWGLETAMKRFLQDSRVFVVGDKYMTDGLVTHALDRVRGAVWYGLFQRTSDDSRFGGS